MNLTSVIDDDGKEVYLVDEKWVKDWVVRAADKPEWIKVLCVEESEDGNRAITYPLPIFFTAPNRSFDYVGKMTDCYIRLSSWKSGMRELMSDWMVHELRYLRTSDRNDLLKTAGRIWNYYHTKDWEK